jgi:hypothetical protein
MLRMGLINRIFRHSDAYASYLKASFILASKFSSNLYLILTSLAKKSANLLIDKKYFVLESHECSLLPVYPASHTTQMISKIKADCYGEIFSNSDVWTGRFTL